MTPWVTKLRRYGADTGYWNYDYDDDWYVWYRVGFPEPQEIGGEGGSAERSGFRSQGPDNYLYDADYDSDHGYQEYEYEPDVGWHAEEWYDPSDWGADGRYSTEHEDLFDQYDYVYDEDFSGDERGW